MHVEMITSFASFIRCLRRAPSLEAMKPCIYNYKSIDWYHSTLYVNDVPTSKQHSKDPPIQTICFSDYEQSVKCEPGLVAMMDGSARVNGRIELYLNNVIILDKPIILECLHPYSTVLHVAADR